MFKTKEELKEQEKLYINPDCAFQFGIDIAFSSFAERVEFYNDYSDVPEVFYEDYPEIAKKVPWLFNTHNYDSDVEMWHAFNEWLFDHCFGDIK